MQKNVNITCGKMGSGFQVIVFSPKRGASVKAEMNLCKELENGERCEKNVNRTLKRF
jgi:hypothetical protein